VLAAVHLEPGGFENLDDMLAAQQMSELDRQSFAIELVHHRQCAKLLPTDYWS